MPNHLKKLDDTERVKITNFCRDIAETMDEMSVLISRHKIGYLMLHRLAREDEKLAEMLGEAKVSRGWKYMEMAQGCLERIEEFWMDHRGYQRERSNSCNKARHIADFYIRMAATLAPETFGDYRYELQRLEARLRDISDKIDRQTQRKSIHGPNKT